MDFARRIKQMADSTDPRRNDYYNYRRYERITIALNNFEHNDSDAIIKRFPFLIEHVDTSEVSGKPDTFAVGHSSGCSAGKSDRCIRQGLSRYAVGYNATHKIISGSLLPCGLSGRRPM